MEKTDIVIIGAGVIGLAVALQTVESHPQKTIILLEQHETFGQETSSRNSEVIHAGIYYPRGSLKARLCVEGKNLLYDFCRRWDVPCQKTGKLIIARELSEIAVLEDLMEQGAKNGVDDLVYLEKAQVRRLEPHIYTEGAILSPSTGVIHSHRLMSQLDFQARQGCPHGVPAPGHRCGADQGRLPCRFAGSRKPTGNPHLPVADQRGGAPCRPDRCHAGH